MDAPRRHGHGGGRLHDQQLRCQAGLGDAASRPVHRRRLRRAIATPGERAGGDYRNRSKPAYPPMSVYFWSALIEVPPTDADELPPTPMSTVGPIVKATRGAS